MNGDNLHPWIEPELEARLVALVLGEASDFEREELERLVTENPELAVFKKRIEAVHGLLREVSLGESEDDDDDWKLPEERRAALLSVIEEGSPGAAEIAGVVAATAAEKEESGARSFPWGLVKIAAMLCLLGALAIVLMPVRSAIKYAQTTNVPGASGPGDRNRFWGFVAPSQTDGFTVADGGVATDKLFSSLDEFVYDVGDAVELRLKPQAAAIDAVAAQTLPESDPRNSLLAITDTLDTLGALSDSIAPAGESGQAEVDFGNKWNTASAGNLGANEYAEKKESAKNGIPMPEIVQGRSFGRSRGKIVIESEPGTFPYGVESDREEMDAGPRLAKIARKKRADVEVNGAVASVRDRVATPEDLGREKNGREDSIMDSEAEEADAELEGVPVPGKIPVIGSAFDRDEKEPAVQESKDPSGPDWSGTLASGYNTDLKRLSAVPQQPKQQTADWRDLNTIAAARDLVEGASGPAEKPSAPAAPASTAGEEMKLQRRAGQLDVSRLQGGVSGDELSRGLSGREKVTRFSAADDGKPAPAPTAAPMPAPKVGNARIAGTSRRGQSVSGLEKRIDDTIQLPSPELSVSGAARTESLDVSGGLVMPGELQQAGAEAKNRSIDHEIGVTPSSGVDSYRVNAAPIVAEAQTAPSQEHPVRNIELQTQLLGESLMELEELEGATKELERTPAPGKAIERSSIALQDGRVELGTEAGKPTTTPGRETTHYERSRSRPYKEIEEQLNSEAEAGQRLEKQVELKTNASDAQFSIAAGQLKTPVTGLNARVEDESAKLNYKSDLSQPDVSDSFGVPSEEEARQVPGQIDQKSASSDGAATLKSKSKDMVAPKIDFDDVPLEGAIEFLRQKSAELDATEVDPSTKDLNIVLQPAGGSGAGAGADAEGEDKSPRIKLNLDNGPLVEAFVDSVTDAPLSQDLAALGDPGEIRESDRGAYRFAEVNRPSLRVAPPSGLDEKSAAEEAFSTFSLHVSDVSFKLAQAALAKGEWPEAGKIRVEEFVNAFDYGDSTPSQRDKVACRVEQAIQPFLQQRNLLRVSMRTAAEGRSGATPLRLTFLLDNSGSMERVDRQETVRRAFALLSGQLQPMDQVTLISFARQPRLLADKVGGDRGRELNQIVANLPSEGGTNLEAALQLAFEKAREQRADGAQNRIVLLTDGAANLGDAEPESLARLIESMRDAGIAFDAAGIGADGLNDEILEALTRKGDGRYYLLDRPEDADAGFARQIAGALRPAAKNVKVQVEFNSKRVGRYKLLGFEKHRLEKEDFRNDSVDAAEMAAEEAGVAVYQVEPLPGGEGDIGSVSVRFRDMSTGRMIEKRWPIPYEPNAPRPDQAEPSMRIATAAALLAAKLKGEPLGEVVRLSELAQIVSGLPERYEGMERVQQLRQMIDQARQLAGE